MSDGKIHSKLGASQYYRWGECPGSVALCQTVPSISSSYATEGTKAHDLARKILLRQPFEISSEEMYTAVKVYVDYVTYLRARRPAFEAVEQELTALKQYHSDLHGTADYVCYFKESKELHVVDYKHGAGVPVDVFENEQLLYYGVAALVQNKFPISKIIITIVQPRCEHPDGYVRSWEVDPTALYDFLSDLLANAKETEKPDAKINPGDHCRFCAAQAICPVLKTKALKTAKDVFGPALPYEPDALGAVLSDLSRIESWCKSVREFAYREIEAGRKIPGWKLVEKRASRKWPEGFEPNKKICEDLGLGIEDFYEKKTKSIPQIEKIIDKSKKVVLEQLTIKESSGKTLAPETDTRTGIDRIKEVFEID